MQVIGADALAAEARQEDRRRQEDRDHAAALERQSAGDDPRGLHDGLGVAASRRESPRAFLDHSYNGAGYPIPAEGLPMWEGVPRQSISGSFAVCRLGRRAAVLDNGEGKRWIVFDLAGLRKVA